MKRSPRMSEAEYTAFEAKRAPVASSAAPAPTTLPTAPQPPAPQERVSQPVSLNGRKIVLVIYGQPQPAGSKQAFVPLHPTKICECGDIPGKLPYRRNGGGIVVSVVDANPKNKKWQAVIAKEAREVYGGKPVEVPLKVTCKFFMPRPQSHFGTGRNANVLKASAPEYAGNKPDAGKLARGTIDALTGIIYKDDALIVSETHEKFYGEPARVEITIEEMPARRAPEPTLPFTGAPPWRDR